VSFKGRHRKSWPIHLGVKNYVAMLTYPPTLEKQEGDKSAKGSCFVATVKHPAQVYYQSMVAIIRRQSFMKN
jgi:hypothetical protein